MSINDAYDWVGSFTTSRRSTQGSIDMQEVLRDHDAAAIASKVPD